LRAAASWGPTIEFFLAITIVAFVSLLIDEALIAVSIESSGTIRLLLGIAILVLGLGLVTFVLRLMIRGASSPRTFAQSRHQLEKLSAHEGSWQSSAHRRDRHPRASPIDDRDDMGDDARLVLTL
jgi:hypothetical protein